MKKRVIKLWGPWASKKMEVWLKSMYESGWNLCSVSPFQLIFTYIKGNEDRGEIYYAIDFHPGIGTQYRLLCEDDYWELKSEFLGWHIWQKTSSDGAKELYTDVGSLIIANKRIIRYLRTVLILQVYPITLLLRNDMPKPIWIGYITLLAIVFYGCIKLIIFNKSLNTEGEEI